MTVFRFADFVLDPERFELRRAGATVALERLPMNLLILLAERRGDLVERSAIIKRLWGAGVFKDTENGINTAVRKIRLALGDNRLTPRFIQTVTGKGYRLNGVAVDDSAARDAYLRGRFFWYRRMHLEPGFCALHGLGAEGFNRARVCFEQALEHDPLYALGYTGLSNYYGAAAVHGVLAPEYGWPLALSAAQKALERDPSLPEAHHATAAVHFFYDWDLQRAEAGFQRAIALNPNHPETHRLYSRVLGALGRVAEAREQSDLSERLDPLGFRGSRAIGLFWAGRYDEAITEFHAVTAYDDVPPLILQIMAMALEITGRYGEAVAATVQSLVTCGEPARAERIDALWRDGGYAAVLRFYLDDLLQRRAVRYTSPLPIAEVYARLHRFDDALGWLDVALADWSSRLCEIAGAPWFRRYHNDPAFKAFLARVEESRRPGSPATG